MLIHADLHIHTTLSPCGDLEMSPAHIIAMARKRGLGILGITDHNSTRQAGIIRDLGKEKGIWVLTGVEITTSEEAHCLAFFEDDNSLSAFQAYLDQHLPDIPNKPEKFGYQVVANVKEEIIYEEKKLLITALNQNLREIEKKVRECNGIFIPAHLDKPRFSILSQLGFIPPDLHYDALEVSANTTPEIFAGQHPELKNAPFIHSSDAHYPEDIGKVSTLLSLPEISFQSLRIALGQLKI